MPVEIIAVFPSVSELSITDYRALLDVTDKARARQITIDALVGCVRSRMEEDASHDIAEPAYKSRIFSYFRSESEVPRKAAGSKKIVTEKLAEFTNKKQFARKKKMLRNILSLTNFPVFLRPVRLTLMPPHTERH